MESLGRRLTAGDPAAKDHSLSAEDAARIRQAILAAAPATGTGFSLAVPLAVALLFLSAGSAWMVRYVAPAERPAATAQRPRQLQFATAGGTRIIWIFNPDLDVR